MVRIHSHRPIKKDKKMNIKTKFDIGFKFFAPRCIKKYDDEEKIIDGVTWYRHLENYESFVKEKIVRNISVTVSKNEEIIIKYRCVDIGEFEKEENFAGYISEDELEKYSKFSLQSALDFADIKALNKETFYGF